MDHIDRHLATAARNDKYKPCIQAALAMGKKLLNKYYSYTDHSELYRISMSKFLFIAFIIIALSLSSARSSSPESQACLFRSSWVAG
jgi:hypothetical protein